MKDYKQKLYGPAGVIPAMVNVAKKSSNVSSSEDIAAILIIILVFLVMGIILCIGGYLDKRKRIKKILKNE